MKKTLKIVFATVLSLVLLMSAIVPAFAATDGSITITTDNDAVSMQGHTYTAYKIFDVTYEDNNYNYTIASEFVPFFESLGISTDADAYTYVQQLENDAALQAFAL